MIILIDEIKRVISNASRKIIVSYLLFVVIIVKAATWPYIANCSILQFSSDARYIKELVVIHIIDIIIHHNYKFFNIIQYNIMINSKLLSSMCIIIVINILWEEIELPTYDNNATWI